MTSTNQAEIVNGENIFIAIERCQRRKRELSADLRAVRYAPISSTTAKKIALAQIEALAVRGRPDVFMLIECGDPILWSTEIKAFMAWLHKDTLIAAINQEIDYRSDDENSLDDETKDKRMAEVQSDILANQCELDSLIKLSKAEAIK